MPRPRRPATPGPLDHLPRPLSDRDRSARGGRRRIAGFASVGVIVAGIVAAAAALAPRFDPVGAVAGAMGSARSPASAAGVLPALRIPPSPRPWPYPTPTGAPIIHVGAPDPATLTGYRWPLPHGRVTLPFGPSSLGSRLEDGQAFHDGLDMATFCGDRVLAAHDGTVLAAGRHFDDQMGWIGSLARYKARLDAKHLWTTLPIAIVMDDGDGYRSIYAHFSKVVVKVGQSVRAGQLIGYEGATGRATGCHVHFGLFSPDETGFFVIEPAVAKRMLLPPYQVARIDPLLVLPHRPGVP